MMKRKIAERQKQLELGKKKGEKKTANEKLEKR